MRADFIKRLLADHMLHPAGILRRYFRADAERR